jgi:putative ABC transport system permease protein
MESLFQDLRYGLRMLVKNPGFTLVAVITMALGIGANTALFSVVNGVLLKSLPFKDPNRLVFVQATNVKFPPPGIGVSTLNFRDLKDQTQSFETLSARQGFTVNLTSKDQPEKIQGEKVTADLFDTMGIAPLAGRTFTPQEDQPGGTPVILLSQGLWQRRFGGDPNIIGQTISINSQETTVIGIMPNDYRPKIEFWMPLAISYENADRSLHNVQIIGRLAPGVTIQQAQTEVSAIAGRLAEQFPEHNHGWDMGLVAYQDFVTVNIRWALMTLLGAVGCVLLIACANVANLLLARAASREKEIAIRLAMGASRGRLIRQVLTESVLISLIGGGAGVLIALWSTQALVSINPQGIPRAGEIGLDGRVLVFALLASVAAGILFGLVPAWQSSKPNVNETLKESGRSSSTNVRGHRLRSVLVVVQIAFAFVLLVCAGLLIRSFSQLQNVNTGFNQQRLLTMQVTLPPSQYAHDDNILSFYREAMQRLSGLPGVVSAGGISHVPLAGGGPQFIFAVEGRPLPQPAEAPLSSYRIVTPNYLETMNIPLIKGRSLTEADNETALQVVVVNQNMADTMWPGEDPLGKRLTVGVPLPGDHIDWVTVVGVVGNVKHTSLSGETGMQMYQTMAQTPFLGIPQLPMGRTMNFVLRTQIEPTAMAESARGVIAGLNPTLPVSNMKTMDTIISESVASSRFNTSLFGLFAAIALSLTIVGIFGVMNYAVTQRTQEIGIRMALGAQPGQVRSMILRQGMMLSGIGLVIGLGGCFIATPWLASLLFGVKAIDPLTLGAVALVLAGVALLTCYIPARRATKVDPIIALRYE